MPLAWLVTFATSHTYLVYGLVVVLACAEGPILSILFGVLIKLELFPLIPVYAALMVGDLIGDVAYYYVGLRHGRGFVDRFGKYLNVTQVEVDKMEKFFHRYKNSILFLSKISNGLGLALVTLMTAGMIRIPFWRYMTINIVGQFIWSGFLLAFGYFFGQAYLQVNNVFERASIVTFGLVILICLHQYQKYLRKRVEAAEV